MAKTTKATQTNKAAETRAAAEKALAEQRKTVRDTALYGKIKDAIGKAIEKAASEGASGIAIPAAKIPGELGSPRHSRWHGDWRVRAPCARGRDPCRGSRVGGLQDPSPVRRAGRGRLAQARRGVTVKH